MVGFEPRVERYHLDVGQPVFMPGQQPAVFIEYADRSRDRSVVMPVGSDTLRTVFTLTLRPNEHLARRVFSRVEDIMRKHEGPPGMEHVVSRLKEEGEVDNPFAVAWAMKKGRERNEMEGGSNPDAKSMSDKEASALSGASLRQVGIPQTALTATSETKPNRGKTPRLQDPAGVVRK